ncbi:MAG: adenylosuccinate lyase [Silicimonas sp.]|nr:adenylosuccinate lyase [Silicimonas sp.]
MKAKILLVTLVLATAPSLAAAQCSGDYHEQVTMSCPEGQTFDTESKNCITPTG